MHRPQPTGEAHEASPQELFFSTTDSKGVIKLGNSVFERLSRYSIDALIGAPHNIIRHPDMPAGAFKLMWETLETGRPFCAYITNLAGDGSRYAVFATIIPLGEDYLSIHSRPCRDDLHGKVRSMYAEVRPVELAARAKSAAPLKVANLGLARLSELVAEAGFDSYDEFMWEALPAEVLARAQSVGDFPTRITTGSYGYVLEAATRVYRRLGIWVEHLAQLHDAATALLAGIDTMSETVAHSEATAVAFEAATAGQFTPSMLNLTVWTSMIQEITEMHRGLQQQLEELHHSCTQARFQAALAMLHNDTVAQFACEEIDGTTGPSDPGVAITALVTSLGEHLRSAAAHLEATVAQAASASERAAELSDLIAIPTALIDNWREAALDDRNPRVTALMPETAAVIERSHAGAEALAALATQCQDLAKPLDVTPILAELNIITSHLGSAA